MKVKNIILILVLISSFNSFAQQEIKLLDKAILLAKHTLTKTAYCSDGSDRARDGIPRFHGPMEAKIISFLNYQYIAYYEGNGDIVIARKKIEPNSEWEKSIIQGYKIKSEDRHNKIALSISSGDGVIHIAFDHHNTPQFNYAHSKPNVAANPDSVVWDNTVFSLQPNLDLKTDTGLVTYPTFYRLNTTGNLMVYWRTGGAVGGEMNLANYHSKDHKWYFIGQISTQDGTYKGQEGTRGPYNGGFIEDANSVLHVAWVFKESEDHIEIQPKGHLQEHGLFYAQSSDGGFSWKDNAGNIVADVKSNKVMGIDNLRNVPVEIPMSLDPSHVGLSSITDSKTNNFLTLLGHYQPRTKQRKNYLYSRTPDGEWTRKETNLNHLGKVEMQGDILYVFNESGVSFSHRDSDFKIWKTISMPIMFEKGSANWDLKNLDIGLVTMVIQYNPKKLGEPTPVEVFDFKIFK